MIWPHGSLCLDVEVYADQHEEILEELEQERAEREAWDAWADEEAERHRDDLDRSHIIKLEWPVQRGGGDAA
jgi:hypothetical protein